MLSVTVDETAFRVPSPSARLGDQGPLMADGPRAAAGRTTPSTSGSRVAQRPHSASERGPGQE
jgi:hypothetical protein